MVLEKELKETKNDYFEIELEIKKYEKELRDVKMKYLKVHKQHQEESQNEQENFINQNYSSQTIKGGGFLFKKPKMRQLEDDLFNSHK